MDKKDLEELEDWKRKKIQYVETYGIDIFNPKNPNKKSEKIFKILDKVTKSILIGIIILIIIVLFGGLIVTYVSLNAKVHINPKDTISKMYGKHVKIITKDLDQNRNGSYFLTIKENKEIQFRAITEWQSMKNDYSDRCEKYYFEKWENEYKNNVKTTENYNEGLLEYSVFLEIAEEETIPAATFILYDFIKSADKIYYPDWDVYIKIGEYRLYPFTNSEMTIEQAIESAHKKYEEAKNAKKAPEVDETPKMIRDLMGAM